MIETLRRLQSDI